MGNDDLDDLKADGQSTSIADKKMKQMEALLCRRTISIDQIKRCSDFVARVKKNTDLTSIPELKTRLKALDSAFSSFQKVQQKIEEGDLSEVKNDTRSDNEESYYLVSSEIKVMLNKFENPPSESMLSHTTETRFDPIKLPKIEFPIFTGDITAWMPWFETFNSLVHNNSHLSTLSKFHHLVSKLGETAKSSIEGLKIIEENYEEAVQRLKERFENRRVIAQEHLHRIFNLPKIIKPSAAELRNLIDKTTNHLTSLRNLKRPVDQWDDLIVYILTTKLDSTTAQRWNEESPVDRLPTLIEFNAFIKKRCQILEGSILNNSISYSNGIPHTIMNNTKNKNQRNSQKSLTTTVTTKPKCLFCLRPGHFIYKCFKLLNMPLADRYQQIKGLNLCENCLKTNQHSESACPSSGCHMCGERHHTLLHYDNKSNSSSTPVIVEQSSYQQGASQPSSSNVLPTTSNFNANAAIYNPSPSAVHTITTPEPMSPSNPNCQKLNTLLATALINVCNNSNQLIPCRVLLDSGSQLNLISERFIHMLGLKKYHAKQLISGISQNLSSSCYKATLAISSRLSKFETSIEVIVLNKLTNCIPETNIDITNWNIPKNIPLSDPLFYKSQRIDLVLGAELFFELMSVGQIKLGSNLPILQKTIFGWVVSGPYQNYPPVCYFAHISQNIDCDINLHDDLKAFWEIENGSEELGINRVLKKSEAECEKHFISNVCRLSDGRYQVRLPFKENAERLGDSYNQALKRFKYLERKLLKNNEIYKTYSGVINEFITLGHMELAPCVDFTKSHFFLPHHCVMKPSSSTTKMRVVFDGSAKSTTGTSLNDTLLIGPVVQNDLFSIATRFRSFAFVFTADISKMYRQISMHPADRCFHLVLWRDKECEDVKTYQLTTVTYGTASASYLATKALQTLAVDEGHDFPNAAKSINKDFYVDDVLTGASTLEGALQIKRELIGLLSRGGFILRKWCSNDERILKDVEEGDRETLFQIANGNAIKTLGTYWNPSTDKLLYDCSGSDCKTITKRTVLSEIARLFDPLGLINPIIILAKVFMQQLWRQGFAWDESLPLEYHSRWLRFREELVHIKKFEFDRRVFYGNKGVQLHAFADSSEYAYGACLYLRSVCENGSIVVKLLCSKSRVAPVKKISIPRLELCAAVLMVRLVEKVRHIFENGFQKIYYWTDSSIVLSQLSEESSNFNTFVSNRVAVIQMFSNRNQWYHVRSKNNPADVVSRGAYPSELIKSSLWFSGPDYLRSNESDWPNLNPSCIQPVDQSLLERKQQKIILSMIKTEHFIDSIKYHNNYLKSIRVVAYMLRFVHNCKAKQLQIECHFGELSPTELQLSLRCIVRTIQQEYFAFEIQLISNNKPIPGRSHVASLRPFIDSNGILRVGGRISNAMLGYDAKFPMLLPKDHVFTQAMASHFHNKHLHVGPQTLLSLIREQFWPIHGRTICKRVCRKCIKCFRAQPPISKTIMGDLPTARVQQCRPFIMVGVDFCGPFKMHFRRRGTHPIKGYVAVFVCFATRAVHLEVVEDLTTIAFLSALKRFIGRRGYPSTIYSDNATNFIGARNELSAIYKMLQETEIRNEIVRSCAADNIKWKTIPPRSPHFGGLWEAAVKSAKFHMKRILQDASLTFQELNTVVIQIESILNSRPITPLSDKPSDFNALTPSHFLIGSPLACLAEPDVTDVKTINSLSRYQLLQWYFQTFWKRWSREYLQSLQQRTKWKSSYSTFQVGDLVLIVDDNLPPLNWKMGRITQTQPGKDGIVRTATIRTSTGVTQRATINLRKFPINIEGSASIQDGENVQ